MNYPNNITAAQNCRYVTDNRLYVQGIGGHSNE